MASHAFGKVLTYLHLSISDTNYNSLKLTYLVKSDLAGPTLPFDAIYECFLYKNFCKNISWHSTILTFQCQVQQEILKVI